MTSTRISLSAARVEPLPPHGVGDVEAVELDPALAELCPQRAQCRQRRALGRFLQVQQRGGDVVRDPATQLMRESRLADAADPGKFKQARALAQAAHFLGERGKDILSIDERRAYGTRLVSRRNGHP